MTMIHSPWLKIDEGRYTANLGGRTFWLRRNRKTHSHRMYTSWVTIGRKPRRSTTTTWYEVWEKVGEESIDHTNFTGVVPGTLAEAKKVATRVAYTTTI